MSNAGLRFALLGLVLASWVPVVADTIAEDGNSTPLPAGLLTLTGGDTLLGSLQPSVDRDVIEWNTQGFLDPFAFDVPDVTSLQFSVESNERPRGQFAVQGLSGDLITGDIVQWTHDMVVIRSDTMGRVAIKPAAIHHLYRLQAGEKLLVTFANRLADWNTTSWAADGWTEAGDQLRSVRPGATLNGDFDLPQRAVIDFEISWQGQPDFVVALGCDPSQTTDRGADGWRLETVHQNLVAIAESESNAAVALINDVWARSRLRLVAYLNQAQGELRLYRPDGKPVGQIALPDGKLPGSGIRVINRGSNLVLERMRISPWLGFSPGESTDAPVRLNLLDGRTASGRVQVLDAQQLVVQQESEETPVGLENVLSAQFGNRPQNLPAPQPTFFIRNGQRLSGSIVQVTRRHWVVESTAFHDVIHVPLSEVHRVTVPAKEDDPQRREMVAGDRQGTFRVGVVDFGDSQHRGWFTDHPDKESIRPDPTSHSATPPSSDTSSMYWQPLASRRASRFDETVAARVTYRPWHGDTTGQTRPQGRAELRPDDDQDFAELFLNSVDTVRARRARRDQHLLHLHSGDIIACRVDAITDNGVYLATATEDSVVVSHADVKAIELIPKAPLPEIEDAKRGRLLTLPRMQKSSPPTHLLCSHDGDLLRCRLLRGDSEQLVVEVQSAELTVPIDRVTHIIWLHSVESESAASHGDRYAGRVQALWPDGRRLTLIPTASSPQRIFGRSEILGDCEIALDQVDQITLGRSIAQEASELIYADWKLSPATEPLIMQAAEGGAGGRASPLIGIDAPPFQLARLDGGGVTLEQYRGRVVVLDFWASWCAPCMQTLPLLNDAVSGFDSTKVVLIAINVEERREVARDAIDRLGLDVVVALDADGVVSSQYHAGTIPQTIVIAADGKIALVTGGQTDAVPMVRREITELLSAKD